MNNWNKANYYALLICILKGKTADEGIILMGLK